MIYQWMFLCMGLLPIRLQMHLFSPLLLLREWGDWFLSLVLLEGNMLRDISCHDHEKATHLLVGLVQTADCIGVRDNHDSGGSRRESQRELTIDCTSTLVSCICSVGSKNKKVSKKWIRKKLAYFSGKKMLKIAIVPLLQLPLVTLSSCLPHHVASKLDFILPLIW